MSPGVEDDFSSQARVLYHPPSGQPRPRIGECGQPRAAGRPDAQARFAPAFISDLRRDYPAAWEVFQSHLKASKRRGAARLTPAIKSGVQPDIALSLLDMILTRITAPELPDRLRVSRHDLIRTAIAIWGGGALRGQGKSKLLAEDPKAPRRRQ